MYAHHRWGSSPQPPGHSPLLVNGDGRPKAVGIGVAADSRRMTSPAPKYQHIGLELTYGHTMWCFVHFLQLVSIREKS